MRYPTRGYQRDSPSDLLLRRPQEIHLPIEKNRRPTIASLTRKVISAARLGRSPIRAHVRHDGDGVGRSREIVSMIRVEGGHMLRCPASRNHVRLIHRLLFNEPNIVIRRLRAQFMTALEEAIGYLGSAWVRAIFTSAVSRALCGEVQKSVLTYAAQTSPADPQTVRDVQRHKKGAANGAFETAVTSGSFRSGEADLRSQRPACCCPKRPPDC